MTKNQSFTQIPRTKVVELCELTIADIKTRRAAKEKAWIEKHRGTTLWFGFGRPQTDDEVVSAAGWDAFLMVPSSCAWGTLETAQKLLDLAMASSAEFISVTAEDFQAIK